MGNFYKTTCTLVAVVLCSALTASSYLLPEENLRGGPIIEGKPMPIEVVPWQVSLINEKGNHFCGGAIINTRFIVTSAFCLGFKDPEDIQVRSGSSFSNKGGELSNVDAIILHKHYGSKKQTYDIALIELSEPLEFGPSTGAIRLPRHSDIPLDGELVRFTGWAYTSEVGLVSNVLHEALIPILDQDKCKLIYHDDNIFCAGNRDEHLSSCNGESGGPAVLNGVLVGIVSGGQGHPCPKPEMAASVTRVAAFRDWIISNSVEN